MVYGIVLYLYAEGLTGILKEVKHQHIFSGFVVAVIFRITNVVIHSNDRILLPQSLAAVIISVAYIYVPVTVCIALGVVYQCILIKGSGTIRGRILQHIIYALVYYNTGTCIAVILRAKNT